MNKISIVIQMLDLFLNNKTVDSKLVAEELEVTNRTAQRYLQEFSGNLGVVCNDEKKPYKYSLINKSNTYNPLLNQSELELISALINSSINIFDDDIKVNLNNILSKIFKMNLLKNSYYFNIDSAIKYEVIAEVKETLEDFIKEERYCKFYYKKHKNNFDKILPIKIIFYDGFWYLAGKDEINNNIVKTFALHYIENLEGLNEYSKLSPEEFKEYLDNMQRIYYKEGASNNVKVKIHEEIADYFRHKTYMPNQKIIEDNGKDIIIEFNVSNKYEFLNYIRRWLPNITILKPQRYKKAVIEIANKTLENNK
jgi:predicted DNA-binding transcriptional regulator YafY